MNVLYNLRNDFKTIQLLQNGMNSKDKIVGLKNTNGLFGSDKWWSAIEKNKLQLHTMRGTIVNTWPGHHDDYPEFEVVDETGEHSKWGMESVNLHNQIGLVVEIDYVIQFFKAENYGDGTTKCVIEIRSEK